MNELVPVGSYRYPISPNESCAAPIYGVRPVPAHVPDHDGLPKVQVLANASGERSWINVHAENVFLT